MAALVTTVPMEPSHTPPLTCCTFAEFLVPRPCPVTPPRSEKSEGPDVTGGRSDEARLVSPGAGLPWCGQGGAFTVVSPLGVAVGVSCRPSGWGRCRRKASRDGHARSLAIMFCVASQAALKKYQTEQRSKGDALDKCQAELKKLRKKSQGSKNPQKYSDKELQVGAAGGRVPVGPGVVACSLRWDASPPPTGSEGRASLSARGAHRLSAVGAEAGPS